MNEARNSGYFCAETVPMGISAYRREILAYRNQQPAGTKRILAGLLARQLRTLERDPDRPGMRELTMQTISRLSAA